MTVTLLQYYKHLLMTVILLDDSVIITIYEYYLITELLLYDSGYIGLPVWNII